MFIISTYDRDHIESNKQWIEDLLQKDAKWKSLSSISWFFNDVRNSVNTDDMTIRKSEQSEDESVVKVSDLVEEPIGEIIQIYGKDINKYSILYSQKLSLNSITGQKWGILLSMSEIY